MFGGSLGLQRQVQVLRSVCVNLSGAFDVGWPSGFQRPYSVERGAQRTLDYYRGVFSIAVVYIVPIVSSWGLRSRPGMGGTRSRADLFCVQRRSHSYSSYFLLLPQLGHKVHLL